LLAQRGGNYFRSHRGTTVFITRAFKKVLTTNVQAQ